MITASSTSTPQKEVSDLKEINWTLCWKAWLNIGNQKANYIANTTEVISHAQVLLTGYVQIFHALFPHLKACFRREDVENLGKVLLSCVQVPLDTGTIDFFFCKKRKKIIWFRGFLTIFLKNNFRI